MILHANATVSFCTDGPFLVGTVEAANDAKSRAGPGVCESSGPVSATAFSISSRRVCATTLIDSDIGDPQGRSSGIERSEMLCHQHDIIP